MYNPDTVAKLFDDVETNIGLVPWIDYLYMRLNATEGQHGCETLEEFLDKGYSFPEFPELTRDDLDEYNCRMEDIMLQDAINNEEEID